MTPAATAAAAPAQFDMHAVVARLLNEAYALLAALPLLVICLLVLAAAWWTGGWLSRRALLDRFGKRNPFLRDLARTTVRWLVLVAAVVVCLEILDATALVGAVLGTAGVLGVALGFAFKEILENYLAGILLSMRQPFAPRDHVVIDGNEGLIVALNARATILMTLDGNHVRLPNALVFRSVILNYTRNPSRRFEVEVGVGVDVDLVQAQAVGIAELARIDGVIAQPPPRALVVALGDSNVQMRFRGWVDQRSHDFLQVRSEAIRRVKDALERAGMDMPEPIYRVQLSRTAAAGISAPAAIAAQETRESHGKPAAQAGGGSPATSANNDIAAQIEADQHAHGGEDLLRANAPRE